MGLAGLVYVGFSALDVAVSTQRALSRHSNDLSIPACLPGIPCFLPSPHFWAIINFWAIIILQLPGFPLRQSSPVCSPVSGN